MVKNIDVEMKETPSPGKNKKTDPKIEDVAMEDVEAEEPKKDPDLLTLEGQLNLKFIHTSTAFIFHVSSFLFKNSNRNLTRSVYICIFLTVGYNVI